MFTTQTIRQGERVAVWDLRGRVTLVDGPRRLFLFCKTIEQLPLFSASADEYLAIEFKDGHRDHLRGPASAWFDPVVHQAVEVHHALPLSSHEAIVVYQRTNGDVWNVVRRCSCLRMMSGCMCFAGTERIRKTRFARFLGH